MDFYLLLLAGIWVKIVLPLYPATPTAQLGPRQQGVFQFWGEMLIKLEKAATNFTNYTKMAQ